MATTKSTQLIPAAKLASTLRAARGQSVAVAAFLTSPRCPWCIALQQEQIEPRLRADHSTKLWIIELNVDDPTEITLPDNRRRSARQWGEPLGLNLTPTIAMLDQTAKPLLPPLKGYSSRDFYAAYLEDQITAAAKYWQNLR
jgi:hypothetical protein